IRWRAAARIRTFLVPGTWRADAGCRHGPAAGHTRRSRPARADEGTDARLRRRALDRRPHARRDRGGVRAALQGAAPSGARRLRQRVVGRFREWPPRALLSPHGERPVTAEGRRRRLAALRRRDLSGARSSMRRPADGPRPVFQLPWRSAHQIRRDFDDEIAFHCDMRVADLIAQGMSEADARAQVARESGDLADARRYVSSADAASERARHRRIRMEHVTQELRHALRRLARERAFTLTAVSTLALGLAAC